MDERKHRERRRSREKPVYPFIDGDGKLVTSNRRRVVERRSGNGVGETDSHAHGLRLTLRYQELQKELSESSPALVLGRKFLCDVSVASPYASRQHARIEFHGDEFVLLDTSTNGTFVRFGNDDKAVRLVGGEVSLSGNGVISLGRPVRENDEYLIHFSITFAG